MAKREIVLEMTLEGDAFNKFAQLTKQQQQARAAMTKTKKDLRDLAAQFKAGAISEREFERATASLNRELARQDVIASNAGVQMRELRNDLSGATTAGLRFRDKMAEASRAGLSAFGLSAGAVVVGVTALARAMTNAVEIIADFDKSLSNLSAITGLSKNELKDLSDQAKELGSTTAFTASQVLEAQTELAKLGFNVTQVEQATPAVLELAAATGTDLANAATIAAQTLNGFQLSAEETGRIVDVIAQSANLSAFDIDTFSAAMSNAAPAAKAVGVEVEEAAAMLSALVDAGIPAEKAGTDLRNIFIDLADKGLTLDQAYAQITGSQDQLTTAVGLFDQRAAGSALILANNTDKVQRLSEAYNDAAGTAAKMAEAQLDNLRGDQLILQSAWEGFILSIEDGQGAIGGFFRSFTQGITSIIGYLTVLEGIDPFGRFGTGPGSILKEEEATKLYREELRRTIEARAEELGWKDKSFAATLELNKLSDEELNNMRERTAVQLSRLKTTEDLAAAEDRVTKALQGQDTMTAKGAELAILLNEIKEKRVQVAAAEAAASGEVAAAQDQEIVTLAKLKEELKVLQEQQAQSTTREQFLEVQNLIDAKNAEIIAITGNAKALKAENDERKKQLQYFREINDLIAQEALRDLPAGRKLIPIKDFLPPEEEFEGEFDSIISTYEQGLTELELLDFQYKTGQIASDVEYWTKRAQLVDEYNERVEGSVAQLAGSLAQFYERDSEEFKAFAIIEASINAYRAAANALNDKEAGPSRFVQAAAALAQGLAYVSAIQGFAEGGFTGPGSKHQPRGVVHAGEWVAPAWQVRSPQFAPIIEWLESQRKNRGGYEMPFVSGGFVPDTISTADINSLEQRITAQLLANRPMYVDVVEINKAQGRVRIADTLSTA